MKSIKLFLFLLGPILLFGQQDFLPADIYWGQSLKEPNGTFLSKIIGSDGTGFYAVREKLPNALNENNPKIVVEYYNSKMSLRKAKEISLKYKKKNRKFEDFMKFGGNLYLLTSFNNQKQEKNYLFVQSVSTRSLLPRSDLKMIAEIQTRNAMQLGSFDYEISKDSSKVLIYNQLPYKKGEPERFALQVFDQDFNQLWNKEISLPYPDERYSVEEYQVDNNGNVYLLGVIYQDRIRVRRQGRPTYQYNILTYTEDGNDAEEYRINLGNKFITDLTFRPANNGDLVCSGFYSDKGTYSVKGTYYFRINPQTKEMSNKNLKAFDFDFLTEYFPRGKKERARKANSRRSPELYRYALNDLILRSDGGAVLIAEQYFVYTVRDNNFNGFYGGYYNYYNPYFNNNQFDYYYNYNDIIVVNITPEGEIEWTTRIPKRQETFNDGGYFSSYAMSTVKDKLFFIYNDNARNFDPNENRLHNFNGKYSVIAVTQVNKDGTADTYPMFSNRDAGIITRPKICKQLGRRSMIVYGERGRSYKFANLRFKE